MKRILILILIVMLLLPYIAYSASIDLTQLTDKELNDLASKVALEQLNRSKSDSKYLLKGDYGSCHIGLKEILTQEKNGKKVLLLVLDFSHESDEAENFLLAANIKVYQDGIELDSAFFYDHPSSGNGMKNIKKGAVLEVVKAYELRSNSPIEIEMNELFNFSGRKPDSLVVSLP